MDELVVTIRSEAAKWSEVSQGTRLTYERNAATLASGWDIATAAKGTRYAMRAGALWTMRRTLRRIVREADKLRKSGRAGHEFQPVQEAMFEAKMREALPVVRDLEAVHAMPWTEKPDALLRAERSHKQRAVRDGTLVTFYEAAKGSAFYDALLVAEFGGVRGEEFAHGVRVEVGKIDGEPFVDFFIESAKTDGKAKGLDVRKVRSVFPKDAAAPVRRRWLELAKLTGGESVVVSLQRTAGQTVGQRFTNACKTISRKAGVHLAAYSLRHRFSAQVK